MKKNAIASHLSKGFPMWIAWWMGQHILHKLPKCWLHLHSNIFGIDVIQQKIYLEGSFLSWNSGGLHLAIYLEGSFLAWNSGGLNIAIYLEVSFLAWTSGGLHLEYFQVAFWQNSKRLSPPDNIPDRIPGLFSEDSKGHKWIFSDGAQKVILAQKSTKGNISTKEH